MDLKDLRKMGAFNNNVERHDHVEYVAQNAIVNMRYYAKELLHNYNDYLSADKSSRMSIVLFSAMRSDLNDYVQTFIDSVSALCYNPANSLRSMVRSFLSEYNVSRDLEAWVNFLVRRNDLVHDYLNRDFVNEELLDALSNYEDSVIELVDFIESELQRKNLMNVKVHK